MCFSQTHFRSWFDGQILIDGKGISWMADSVFSMNMMVGLSIPTSIKTLRTPYVIDIIQRNARIQNNLK